MSNLSISPPKVDQYTFYWLDGTRTVARGLSVSDAFSKAGYGCGATRALDFTSDGDDHNYVWNSETKQWVKKAYIPE